MQTKDAPISLQSVTSPEVLNGMTLNQKQPSQKTMDLIPPEISLELAQLETRKIQYLSDDAASETSIESNGLGTLFWNNDTMIWLSLRYNLFPFFSH